MIKRFLPFIFIFGLIACNKSTLTIDYFGQTEPGTTPEIFAKDVISIKGRFEHGISFAPNSQELAFGIFNKGDFSGTIYYSNKEDRSWTKPEVLEPLENESVFLPYFSPSGKSLLFAQSRPDANNGFTDIWMLTKQNGFWEQPEKIDSPISTLTRESTACMSMNNTIYFSSNRDGNGLADLYCSSLENNNYIDAERLNSISSVRDEESIFVSANESYIIFSRYATNENGPDLFISYRDYSGNWIQPELLGSKINTSDWERRPFVSIDNRFLFFTKQIFNDKGYAESDIYWVNTQNVFKPYVFEPIQPKVIKIGKEFNVSIPTDYFKDIDSDKLEISLKNEKLDWVNFDKEKMTLTMNPNVIGEFSLIFTAVDEYANETEDTVSIIVEE
ncbi:PD40 domain-containing protein [Carboxylicivirga sp. M1479]|uniref:PD40 domain-containing protein n=1 Tax=Carboxylicivirga sp. M1479 TaxID=2594476 RepID=UPI00163DB5B6|nr:PD40 domain-containing protein [Carboxylicivirga sp. M1479]